jgi:hypothetical protein
MDASQDRALASCVTCQHKDLGVPTCSAYPLGIPKIILAGKDRHLQSRGDDAGIVYAPLSPLAS